MTNAQAQGYAVVALKNMIKAGDIPANKYSCADLCKALDYEMSCLFDEVAEEEAEQRAARILQGGI